MAGANTSQHDVMVFGLAAWSGHMQPFKGTIRVTSINVVPNYRQQQQSDPVLQSVSKTRFSAKGNAFCIGFWWEPLKKDTIGKTCMQMWGQHHSVQYTYTAYWCRVRIAALTTLHHECRCCAVSLLFSVLCKVVSVTPWRNIMGAEVQLHSFLPSALRTISSQHHAQPLYSCEIRRYPSSMSQRRFGF